jgi:CubicO group peptidase (beta-lactamase class C family)
MRTIRLGQLLAMTAGIRGNNPGKVHGREVMLDPPGPDGAPAMRDEAALSAGLWCDPGGGYSYASASVHLASMWLRAASGMEMEEFVRTRLAAPLGWSRWGFAYKHANLGHTPGAGGIALRGPDMLRFLYLLLQEGRWNGKQVIPSWYIREATRRSRYNPHSAYSLQFDINDDGHVTDVPRDAYWKSGSGGHALYVIPSLRVVAWKLGGRDGQYSERDTGMPETPPSGVPALAQSGVDAGVALEETLRRVAAAVRK